MSTKDLEKLDTVIKLHILWMLEKYGSQVQAAKAMGISTKTIRNYLRRMGIPATVDTRPILKQLTAVQRGRYENKDR